MNANLLSADMIICSLATVLLIVVTRLQEPDVPLPMNSADLFSDSLNGDLLLFKWAHAVNSRQSLQDALSSEIDRFHYLTGSVRV